MAKTSTNTTLTPQVSITSYLSLYRKITQATEDSNVKAAQKLQDDTIAAKIKSLPQQNPSAETIDAILSYASKTGLQ